MAFLKGLFEKKQCSICGGDIGLLGNRKLEDGNCCKTCAAKLSPWFSDRRSSTVEEIKAQIDMREQNKELVKAFNTTRTMGRSTKVYVDENAGKFMVTSASKIDDANPDVLDLSQVTGCDVDIDESKSEEKRKDNEGKLVSYVPPKYKYSYNFYIILHVNHPYFNEMRFRINPSSVSTGFAPAVPSIGTVRRTQMTIARAGLNTEYQEYEKMAAEICEFFTSTRSEARAQAQAAAAPKIKVTCPLCGATTFPDANGCCEYCGGVINA